MSYINTFITISPDSEILQAEVPASKRSEPPAHMIQFKLLTEHPYRYTHEELIFETYLIQKKLTHLASDEKEELWQQLFSKGHPCLRASSLTKKQGYGAHYNEEGKIALFPVESKDYEQFIQNTQVKKIPAMRNKRATS